MLVDILAVLQLVLSVIMFIGMEMWYMAIHVK